MVNELTTKIDEKDQEIKDIRKSLSDLEATSTDQQRQMAEREKNCDAVWQQKARAKQDRISRPKQQGELFEKYVQRGRGLDNREDEIEQLREEVRRLGGMVNEEDGGEEMIEDQMIVERTLFARRGRRKWQKVLESAVL
jgi:chromosome segregation ATPase